MAQEINAIRQALSDARSAYHDSELWSSETDAQTGATYDAAIEAACAAADKRIAELEALVAQQSEK
jgi:hypothetical protein